MMNQASIGIIAPRLIMALKNLNLFPSIPPTTDQHLLKTQIISTRLFIISLSISLAILILYTSTVTINKTLTLNAPTSQEYAQIYAEHSTTLICPCTNIAIDYENIVVINYTLHQVCSSDFVTHRWITHLDRGYYYDTVLQVEFRTAIQLIFHSLRSFCTLAKETLANSLTGFYANQYVTSQVVPRFLLESQSRSLIDQFRSSTVNSFSLSLSTVRETTQTNWILTTQATNAGLLWNMFNNEATYSGWRYGNCRCDTSARCKYRVGEVNLYNTPDKIIIPGFYYGCYPIEAASQSNLQCLYDDMCFSLIQSFLNISVAWNGTILDINQPSRFKSNTTIGDMVQELFVEEWNWTLLYDDYFLQCAPKQCSYTVQTRNDVIYIVTTVIGLIGGLVTALKLIVPNLVKLIRRKKNIRSNISEANGGGSKVLLKALTTYLQNFNLFPSIPPTTDQHLLKTQIISTRLFIVSLSISLAILILYTSTVTINKTLTLHAPTSQEYAQIYAEHSTTLICPCTNIAIDYENIVFINYTLHQVCSSDFVTDEWILYIIRPPTNWTPLTNDFRQIGPYLFQGLRSFCTLAKETLANSLTGFYANQYVTSQVVPRFLLESQSRSLIDQFRSSTVNSFSLSLSTVRDAMQTNSLYATQGTNARFVSVTHTPDLISATVGNAVCKCAATPKCKVPLYVYRYYDITPLSYVPGMYFGCYHVEALLQSTLQCFYNEICFNQTWTSINASTPLLQTVLDINQPSRFKSNTTIGDMVQELFVEEWNWTLLYDDYFLQCAPKQCSYTVETRNDVIYIVTTVIGLIGGLVTALKVIVPNLVKLIRKKSTRRGLTPTGQESRFFTRYWKVAVHYFRHFNLFPSIPPTTDQHLLKTQIISTRLFIISLSISLAILILYTSTVTINKTLTLHAPTSQQYAQIYAEHSTTLICPCTNIAIDYENIVFINYTLHQVCSSDFVTDRWVDYLMKAFPVISSSEPSFRHASPFLFQGLRSFCTIANRMIINHLVRFYRNQYVTGQMVPQFFLENEIRSSIDQFRSSIVNAHSLALNIVRETTQANWLLSSLRTNARLWVFNNSTRISRESRIYNGCSCSISNKCTQPIAFYDSPNSSVSARVQGVRIGCYIVEALLQSTLECLYDQICFNQMCFNQLRPLANVSMAWNGTILDINQPSRFKSNTTIGDMVQELFVEEWNWTLLYDDYFLQCAPKQCSYTVQTRNDVIYIVTTVIGLIGGLVTALKLIVPRIVWLVYYVVRKRRSTRQVTVRTMAKNDPQLSVE